MASIKLTSKSGNEYEFDLHAIDAEFPETGGIYVVTANKEGNTHTILYIGRTNNFKTRHQDHHKAECFAANGATHLGIFLEENELKRIFAEFDLQSNYVKMTCAG